MSMLRPLLISLVLTMTGCYIPCADFKGQPCSMRVGEGTCIILEGDVDERWVGDPSRIYKLLDVSARYWGAEGIEALESYTVKLQDEPVGGGNSGKHWGECDAILMSTGAPYQCLEQTALAHEVGHAIVGDHDHKDPRWQSDRLWSLAVELSEGVSDCVVSPRWW